MPGPVVHDLYLAAAPGATAGALAFGAVIHPYRDGVEVLRHAFTGQGFKDHLFAFVRVSHPGPVRTGEECPVHQDLGETRPIRYRGQPAVEVEDQFCEPGHYRYVFR